MPTGMQENDRLVFFDHAATDQIDESGHRLAGVHRIEHHAFRACREPNGLGAFGCQRAIRFADVLVEYVYIINYGC